MANFFDDEYAAIKISSAFVMLILTLLCSCVPWIIRSRFRRSSKLIMSYLTCIAGGVVLGALLMHMIPEMEHVHLPGYECCSSQSPSLSNILNISESGMNLDDHILKSSQDDQCGHDHEGDNSGKHHKGPCNHDHHHHKTSKSKSKSTKSTSSKKKDSQNKKSLFERFKWAQFFAGFSFLLLLAIDRLFMHEHSHGHEHAPSKEMKLKHTTDVKVDSEDNTNRSCILSSAEIKPNVYLDEKYDLPPPFSSIEFGGPTDAISHSHGHECHDAHHHKVDTHKEHVNLPVDVLMSTNHYPCQDDSCAVNKKIVPGDEVDECASCHSENLMGGCHMDGLNEHSSKTQAIIFVFALSMHSFLEGLAICSKNSSESLTQFLISLFAHKWLEAFALGVNIMNASFPLVHAILILIFYAFLTPFGMILGMVILKLVSSEATWAAWTVKCLNGLAVGSFLFVSCIEMIPPEFHKRTRHTIFKFMALCLGFIFMAGMSMLSDH